MTETESFIIYALYANGWCMRIKLIGWLKFKYLLVGWGWVRRLATLAKDGKDEADCHSSILSPAYRG